MPRRRLRARLGRLLVSAGRFAEALAIVEPPLVERGGRGRGGRAGPPRWRSRRRSWRSAYLGDLAAGARAPRRELGRCGGRRDAARLPRGTAGAARRRRRGRRAGRVPARLRDCRRAERRAHGGGRRAQPGAACSSSRGSTARRWRRPRAAVRELGRLGATTELVPALVNAANLFVEVGDLGGRAPGARPGGRPLRWMGAPAGRARPRRSSRAIWRAGGATRRRPSPTTVGAPAGYRESAQPAAPTNALLALAEVLAATGPDRGSPAGAGGGGAAARPW